MVHFRRDGQHPGWIGRGKHQADSRRVTSKRPVGKGIYQVEVIFHINRVYCNYMANLRIPLTTPLWIGCLPVSPLGPISAAVTSQGLARVEFCAQAELENELAAFARPDPPVPNFLAKALAQIDEYLNGRRRQFDLPIDWRVMPDFHARSLRLVQAIPYGEVRTYGEVARALGQPRAAIAVGSANAANPIPLVLPCHRLIGSDRRLHGYGGPGGLATKAWLLRLEGCKEFFGERRKPCKTLIKPAMPLS
jgi:methylated-DNA-[protein]-cysteine S-methyltransferase